MSEEVWSGGEEGEFQGCGEVSCKSEEFKAEVGLHQGLTLSSSHGQMVFADHTDLCSVVRVEQMEEHLKRWRFNLESRAIRRRR